MQVDREQLALVRWKRGDRIILRGWDYDARSPDEGDQGYYLGTVSRVTHSKIHVEYDNDEDSRVLDREAHARLGVIVGRSTRIRPYKRPMTKRQARQILSVPDANALESVSTQWKNQFVKYQAPKNPDENGVYQQEAWIEDRYPNAIIICVTKTKVRLIHRAQIFGVHAAEWIDHKKAKLIPRSQVIKDLFLVNNNIEKWYSRLDDTKLTKISDEVHNQIYREAPKDAVAWTNNIVGLLEHPMSWKWRRGFEHGIFID